MFAVFHVKHKRVWKTYWETRLAEFLKMNNWEKQGRRDSCFFRNLPGYFCFT